MSIILLSLCINYNSHCIINNNSSIATPVLSSVSTSVLPTEYYIQLTVWVSFSSLISLILLLLLLSSYSIPGLSVGAIAGIVIAIIILLAIIAIIVFTVIVYIIINNNNNNNNKGDCTV